MWREQCERRTLVRAHLDCATNVRSRRPLLHAIPDRSRSRRLPPCFPPQHSGVLCASSRQLGRTPSVPRRPGALVARDRPWCRVRCADTPIRASPWLLFRLFPDQSIHLGTVSSRSQVGHVVARFTSIRDWRAVLFVMTFWSLVREFSPLETYAGWTKNTLGGWFRKPGHGTGIALRL